MSNTLKNVNTRMCINSVKKIISDYWKNNQFCDNKEVNQQHIERITSDYLNAVKIRKGIQNYRVETFERKYTWKDLYPNIVKRQLAKFACNILKLDIVSNEIKWYHYIFPYKKQTKNLLSCDIEGILEKARDDELSREELDVLVEFLDELPTKMKEDLRYASLETPHEVAGVNVYLHPTKSCEYIVLRTEVSENKQDDAVNRML